MFLKKILAPAVCVYNYDTIENAIERANSLPFAFQASVYTENLNIAMHAIQNLNAMTVMVNDHTAFRVNWIPFAGVINLAKIPVELAIPYMI